MNVLLKRDDEVDALELALRELAGGRGGPIFVDAAAGIGKTALLRHARDGSLSCRHGVRSWSGTSPSVPRHLFEPVLPSAGPARQPLFTGAAADTERLFGATDASATDSPYQLLSGLYWLPVNLVAATPAVVLVDDAQWVGGPSPRFLGFLARRLGSLPVAVVVASRGRSATTNWSRTCSAAVTRCCSNRKAGGSTREGTPSGK